MITKYVNMNGNSSHREVYNVDEDCKRLKNGNYREAPDSMIEWHDLSLCQHCEEGVNPYE